MKIVVTAFLALLLSLSPPLWALETLNGQEVEALEWDALMPPDFSFEQLYGNQDFGDLEDFDPRAQQKLDDMMQALRSAPVVPALDGKMVRIPGFVVPLDGVGQKVTEFFLVPYFGACIHTPPPPSNQIILTRFEPGTDVKNLFDAVWITGTLKVESFAHEVAASGYSIEAYRIEPYTE
ncbi:DUF3299 domain-containing protein [Marinobacterium sedimentorum]|uniref:DUF3299 domain-containing protein n=1 Tax=Marinobacterium sedimentorum TaxID=2927804 RepID=UPI0020C5F403|nr:DUF3299 domain-containing protein [Marinobacterium sedimentorum]MCP8688633.1 DUF3299 domain-containing protein [Marinobacterium sedimentorum]